MMFGGATVDTVCRPAMDIYKESIGKIKALVYERSHLSFPENRDYQLRRWLEQRMQECNFATPDEYYLALYNDESEFSRLISLITTKETYFFRMPEQFEALSEIVLPDIIDREGRQAMSALARGEPYRMRLRVWSAGCSTGEEAYSIAMQILDTIRYPKAWDIKIIGTDINADVLETARRGEYDATRPGNLPPRFIERFFEPSSPGRMMVADEVKELLRFEVFNLRNLGSAVSFRGVFDVIFCRNVMIYFDLDAQQRLVEGLSACLRPGGYLFTGEGEVLHLYNHNLEIIESGPCIFYKKRVLSKVL